MAKNTFSGPVRTGKDTGAPETTTIGTLVAVQLCTVSNLDTVNAVVLPPDCELVDTVAYVRTPTSVNATITIGVTADVARYATIAISSAAGVYRPGVASAAAWKAGTGMARANPVLVATSATSTFDAVVGIFYLQRS